MIIIQVKGTGDKSIESALKAFKYKVQKTKLIQQVRDRSEFVKPSSKRRKQIRKAIYIQKLKDKENIS